MRTCAKYIWVPMKLSQTLSRCHGPITDCVIWRKSDELNSRKSNIQFRDPFRAWWYAHSIFGLNWKSVKLQCVYNIWSLRNLKRIENLTTRFGDTSRGVPFSRKLFEKWSVSVRNSGNQNLAGYVVFDKMSPLLTSNYIPVIQRN